MTEHQGLTDSDIEQARQSVARMQTLLGELRARGYGGSEKAGNIHRNMVLVMLQIRDYEDQKVKELQNVS